MYLSTGWLRNKRLSTAKIIGKMRFGGGMNEVESCDFTLLC